MAAVLVTGVQTLPFTPAMKRALARVRKWKRRLLAEPVGIKIENVDFESESETSQICKECGVVNLEGSTRCSDCGSCLNCSDSQYREVIFD